MKNPDDILITGCEESGDRHLFASRDFFVWTYRSNNFPSKTLPRMSSVLLDRKVKAYIPIQFMIDLLH
jgi:hypothetical protein